jgi:serine/threonine protein kinase
MARSSPSSETQITAESFLRTVLRSGLMDREQLQAGLKGVPRDQRKDPQALANHLVRNGRLSRFQASKLLKGVASGLVIGPFQILAPLGKGGMGWVFLATDARNQALVALKILPPRRARKEERTLARFRREMDLSQKVSHPHLAWTYDVGQYHGVHYIAMEFIPGKTLSRLVNDDGPLSLPRAARLLSEVALGLEHAHEQGLTHRDLKPSNIQITPSDHAKILDLGLALLSGETDLDPTIVGGQGIIVGTMDYIAPEQTTDALGVGPRSDIYSLGCTLYFALTGQPPFPGGSSREKVLRQRSEEPVPLENLRPDLPGGFVQLMRRLMHKDPEKRPSSAQEVAALLGAWATGESPSQAQVETVLDEAEVLQSVGSSEFSAISLPVLEYLDEEKTNTIPLPEVEEIEPDEEGSSVPVWIAVAVSVVVALMGVGVVLALLVMLVLRR